MSYPKNGSTGIYISTASDTVHPLSSQIEGINEIGDILMLNLCPDAGASVDPVPGWTEMRDSNAQAVGHAVLRRVATARNEVLPDIVLSAANSMSANYIVIYGSAGVGNTAYANGASTTPTWPTIDVSANSCVLFMLSIDGVARTLNSISTGLIMSSAVGNANAFVAKQFYPSAGPTGSVTGTISASDGWQVAVIEMLDNGVGEIPIRFANVPAEAITPTTHTTDGAWRTKLAASGKDPRDGSSIAAEFTFDAATAVDATLDMITLPAHNIKTGTVYKADANGNTLPTGMTDGAFYFIHVIDANTVKLMLQNAPITGTAANVAGGYYDDDTAVPTLDITAVGSGTCKLVHAPFMFVGFNTTDTIARPGVAIACHHNFYCLPIKFTGTIDASQIRLITSFATTTGSVNGEFFMLEMDSDGDYRVWKIAAAGKGLTTATAVHIRADNQNFVYEYGTFNSAALEFVVFFYRGNADDSRMNAVVTWKVSTSIWVRKAEIIGGAGTISGTWQDVFTELRLYTTLTSSFSALASSQMRFSHVLQFGNGTDQLVFKDFAKALSFDPASDGVLSLTRYFTQNGVLLKLSATDVVEMSNELIASDAPFDWAHDAASHASAELTASPVIYSKASPVMRAADIYSGCTFTGCAQIQTKGASLIRSTVKLPSVSAGQAAVLIDTNGSQTNLTVDVTGTNTPYHMALAATVDSYTLNSVTFTGTPGTNKLHVMKSSGSVAITLTGTTNLLESEITSEGAAITFVAPTYDVTINSNQANSLIQIFETGTQTVLASTTGSSLVYTHSSETVDYVIQKAGFIPQRFTNVALSGTMDIDIVLVASPVYDAVHGLTYGVDASWSRANNQLTVPTFGPTGRQVFSLMIDTFISETSLRNTPFNIFMNGPNSMFLINGAEGANDASIENMTLCGVRYVSVSNVVTAEWCGVQSIGIATGLTGEYQQVDGSGTTDARATGVFNELIKYYGDVSHGNFDYSGHLILKYQANGYRPVRSDVLSTYAIAELEPTHYIVAMEPVAIEGFVLGDPTVTGLTITKHATPQSYNAGDGAKDYSITITDTNNNTAANIQRWINYFTSIDATFQGLDPFNWPELIVDNGSTHETIRGLVEGDGIPTLHGVYVTHDGSTPHPDFARFQADDGSYGTPPTLASISITNLACAVGASCRLQIINETGRTAPAWEASTGYTVGDKVLRTTGVGSENTAGLYFVASSTGTSDVGEPTWNTTPGGTTNDGSVIWTCYKVLYYDDSPGSTTYSNTYTNGEEFISGDTYIIRFAELDGATSFKTFDTTGIANASGFSVSAGPDSNPVYAQNGIDGSDAAVTDKFIVNYTNNRIVLDTNQDYSLTEAFAYYCYELTSSDGMYKFWGGVDALDVANYRNNNTVVSVFFDESNGFVKQTDNARWFREDGARPAVDPTTGGYGLEINWRNPVYTVNIGGSALTPSESAKLMGLPEAATNATAVWANATRTLTESAGGATLSEIENSLILAKESTVAQINNRLPADPAAVSDIPTPSAIASATRVELATELGRIDENTSAAKTLTAAYDAAKTAASATQVANLNDFDPATDVVAHVTLVDTCTTNTDMRGTDGANTTAPDNTTIGLINARLPANPTDVTDLVGLATGTQVANLNNLSTAQVRAEADAALLAYDGPTKAEMDAAIDTVPTAGENATAVRQELTPELSLIPGTV